MVASSEPPMLLLAYTPAIETFTDAAPAPPAATAAETRMA